MLLEIKPIDIKYDEDISVNSFSLDSDNVYTINLYKTTCNCPNYMKYRSTYQPNDIRRMCKHLINQYREKIGINELTPFQKFIFDGNQNTLKSSVKELQIENHYSVIGSYDNVNDWWSIYTANSKGEYSGYSYLPTENRWSYNEKPKGIVTAIKAEVNAIRKIWNTPTTPISNTQSKPPVNEVSNGCVWAFIIGFFLFVFILIKSC